MLPKIKVGPFNKGFVGTAKSTTKAPYREIERSPEGSSYGKDSFFITPSNPEEKKRYPNGIKR